MLARLSSALVVAALFAPVASAKVIHVDANVAQNGDGKTWATAFKDLTSAVNASAGGDSILVAQGTYLGSWKLLPGVQLLGGFEAGDTRLTQADPVRNSTILDGQGIARVLEAAPGCVIDGFTIQNGKVGGSGGGGMLINGGNPRVTRCFFFNNTNTAGAGSALNIINKATPTVEYCVFFQNGDAFAGHVIDVYDAGGTYTNLVVAHNFSNGFHFAKAATPKIYNSIFANNTGRSICDITADDNPIVENCLFFGNQRAMYHYRGKDFTSISQVNALGYAKNNIAVDPQFLNGMQGDFRLAANSPAIDAGHPTILPSSMRDAFGSPSVQDGDLDGVAVTDIGVAERAIVNLEINGPVKSGGSLNLESQGDAGNYVVLILGFTPSNGIVAGPLGTLFSAPPWVILPWATIPQKLTLPIPTGLDNAPLQVQGLALDLKGHGNLSNAHDLSL